VQHEPTGRAGRVDALTERDESDADGRKLVEQQNQMSETAPQPIESPTHEHIEPAAFRVAHQRIEGGPAVLRA
jgi:hypothetical protein